jgi:hypothetical protein
MAEKRKRKASPLRFLGQLILTIIIAVTVVIAALFIAVQFTDFNSIGELWTYILSQMKK